MEFKIPFTITSLPRLIAKASLFKRFVKKKENTKLEEYLKKSQLPAQIASLESEQQALQEALADGTLYSTDPARAAVMTARAGAIEDELMAALERWTALSA